MEAEGTAKTAGKIEVTVKLANGRYEVKLHVPYVDDEQAMKMLQMIDHLMKNYGS